MSYPDDPEFQRALEKVYLLTAPEGCCAEVGEYSCRITLEVAERAKERIRLAYDYWYNFFLVPDITPDGEGGVDIEWTNEDKLLMYSVRPEPYKSYVYFDDGIHKPSGLVPSKGDLPDQTFFRWIDCLANYKD